MITVTVYMCEEKNTIVKLWLHWQKKRSFKRQKSANTEGRYNNSSSYSNLSADNKLKKKKNLGNLSKFLSKLNHFTEDVIH